MEDSGYLAFYSNQAALNDFSNECIEVLFNTFIDGYSWNITTNNPTTLILDYIDSENNVYTNHDLACQMMKILLLKAVITGQILR